MMRVLGWIADFGRFWYEFVVGDDWTIAAGVVLALAATWALHHWNVAAWWLLPAACVAVLSLAVRRAQTH